jgi:hypothetical protein
VLLSLGALLGTEEFASASPSPAAEYDESVYDLVVEVARQSKVAHSDSEAATGIPELQSSVRIETMGQDGSPSYEKAAKELTEFVSGKKIFKGAAVTALAASIYGVLNTEAVGEAAQTLLSQLDGIDRNNMMLWGMRTMGSEFFNYLRFYMFRESCGNTFLGALTAHAAGEVLFDAPRFFKDDGRNFCFYLARMVAYDRILDRFRSNRAVQDMRNEIKDVENAL